MILYKYLFICLYFYLLHIMKKVSYTKYGASNVLKISDVGIPKPAKNEILVKVMASSINAIDWKNRKGRFRILTGFFKPRVEQGFDIAGIVKEVGSGISDIKKGSRILGQLDNFKGGAFAQYTILKKGQFIEAPLKIPFAKLAGLPMAATTAWQALLKNANLRHNSMVLINGGSSGVGHYAIQIAKAYGAKVTAVCSTKNLEFCYSLGADNCIDYTKSDFTKQEIKYDIIFDVVNNKSLKEVRNVLQKNGVYIGTTPTVRLLTGILFSMFTGKKAKFVAVQPDMEALKDILNLMRKKKLDTIIDKTFRIDKIIEAHDYSEQSRTVGKVILLIHDA